MPRFFLWAATMDITEIRHAMYQHGFAIIPVTGKNPAIDGWQNISANTELIDLWPKSYPFHKNTGVLTRDTPCIDIDIMNAEASDAVESLLRSRFEEHGMISARIGMSPKRAFLFRTDKPFAKLTLKLIAPNGKGEKIEILGDGGQVVVHGIHPDTKKPYEWMNGTPWEDIRAQDLPYMDETIAREFLRDAAELLTTEYGYKLQAEPKPSANGGAGAARGAADWGKLFADIYTGADFHDATRDLAMSFAGVGMSRAAAITRLREAMDASRAPRDKRWQDRYSDIGRAVETAFEKLGLEREAAQLEQATEQPQPDPPPPPRPQPKILPFHRHGEVDPLEARSWCVHELIPETGSGLFAGQWGSYKTFNALELAHCVMTGRPYLGNAITRPGGVLFFALEGASEIPVRIQGTLEHKGTKRFDRAPFYWVTQCPPLTDPRAAGVIIETAKAVAAEFQERFKLPLSLIVIDTVVAGAGYRREGQDNDAAVTHTIMATMAKVGRALGCFVFGIDHYGKDASVGTRGSSVKEADADIILACLADRTEEGIVSNTRLALRKRRSGVNGEEFPFRPRVVELGTNKYGKPETTLVLDYGEDPNAPARPAKDEWGRGKATQHLRRVVMSLMVDHGEEIRPFRDGKPVQGLRLELVEAEFFKSYVTAGDTDKAKRNAKRMAFQRALDAARDKITARDMHGVWWIWLNRVDPPAGNA
jgi:hypothetical protein